MNKSGLFVPLLLLTLVGLTFSACSSGPKPEIVGVAARDAFPGFDYTVYVDCTIRNNGSDGDVKVSAWLRGGGYWIKRDTVFIAKGTERKVTLVFPEVEVLGAGLSGYEYNCGIE